MATQRDARDGQYKKKLLGSFSGAASSAHILQPTIDLQNYRWLPRKSQIVALSENELDERGVPPPHCNLLAPKSTARKSSQPWYEGKDSSVLHFNGYKFSADRVKSDIRQLVLAVGAWDIKPANGRIPRPPPGPIKALALEVVRIFGCSTKAKKFPVGTDSTGLSSRPPSVSFSFTIVKRIPSTCPSGSRPVLSDNPGVSFPASPPDCRQPPLQGWWGHYGRGTLTAGSSMSERVSSSPGEVTDDLVSSSSDQQVDAFRKF
ncbi:hypothetical protein DFH08DRAFT_956456 [Mycena albidolilacea]|uniref:Uncharacterized protein n=1 Tax=Mycena albidolilacea TaxID=1033008 RepID=A0AAD7ABD4_9AGAR|nr:hypothetical protein DFH08DRAFT_956456 [Mycena albidolilacea]